MSSRIFLHRINNGFWGIGSREVAQALELRCGTIYDLLMAGF